MRKSIPTFGDHSSSKAERGALSSGVVEKYSAAMCQYIITVGHYLLPREAS